MFCSHACVFAQNDNRKSKIPVNFVLPLISIFVRSSAQTNQRSTPAAILFFDSKSHSVAYFKAYSSCFSSTFLFGLFPEWILKKLLKSRWNQAEKGNPIHSNQVPHNIT